MGDNYLALMEPWHEHLNDAQLAIVPHHPAQEHAGIYRGRAQAAFHAMVEELQEELLAYIYAQTAAFFENLIVDVIAALGYGGNRRGFARRVGRSGDGGIDGIIELDELGLDAVYLQGKRLKPGRKVSVHDVRDFVGSLEAQHASKGVFVTTADFSPDARVFPGSISRKVCLIDGYRLTQLMITHKIGTRVTQTLEFQELDRDYFGGSRSSASTQPRK